MNNDFGLRQSLQEFLAKEAFYLDEKDWDQWLALYDEDAEYWVPTWDDDGRLTEDPNNEISLIYYPSRGGLEDRVFRLRTERSAASFPWTRTSHHFTLLHAETGTDGITRARANWVTLSYREGHDNRYFGWSEYELAPKDGDWVIKKKKTIVQNDTANSTLDIYSI